jgi:hypothetical protein
VRSNSTSCLMRTMRAKELWQGVHEVLPVHCQDHLLTSPSAKPPRTTQIIRPELRPFRPWEEGTCAYAHGLRGQHMPIRLDAGSETNGSGCPPRVVATLERMS